MERISRTKHSITSIESSFKDESKLAARPKFEDHKTQYFVAAYGALVFSLTLIMSMINYTTEVKGFDLLMKFIMGIIYILTSVSLVLLMIFLYHNRFKRYEYAISNDSYNEPLIVYSMYGEDMSTYLKFGVVVFGILSISNGVVSSTIFNVTREDCFRVIDFIYNMIQSTFFLCEIIFIIRFNRLIMLMHQKKTFFILAQVIFANIMTWVELSIMKLSKLYQWKVKQECELIFPHISYYLLPCVAEFLIISLVIFYEILIRVGQISLVMPPDTEKEDSIIDLLHRNIIGLSISVLLVFFAFEILILITAMSDDFINVELMKLHLFEEIFLYMMGITTNLVLFLSTKKFKFSFSYHISNIDINLLLICSFFTFVYCIGIFVSAIFINIKMLDNGDKSLDTIESTIVSYRAAASVIEGLNVIIQTFVLKDGFHRCNQGNDEDVHKRGQGTVIILIGINVSLWLVKSLQLRLGDIIFNDSPIRDVLVESQNQLTAFFLFFTTPISILYRYHSSVCFANILTRMYEDESVRFECIMRVEGIHYHMLDGVREDRVRSRKFSTRESLHRAFSHKRQSAPKSTPHQRQPKDRNSELIKSMKQISNAKKRIKQSRIIMEKYRMQLKELF